MKKLWIILLTISLLILCALAVNAANTYSGQCGDNLTWTLDGNTLTISGTGDMYDYSEENPAPWSQIPSNIFLTKIEDGVTSIGAYAFAQEKTGRAWISASVRTVGASAFANFSGVKLFFLGAAPTFAEDFASNGYMWIYCVHWDDAIKRNYGGEINWYEAELSLDAVSSKQLIGLDETLQVGDLAFKVYDEDQRKYLDYTPAMATLSYADNSTYGEKNITVTVDGYTFPFTYFVTDGTNHLDLIDVQFGGLPAYTGMYVTKRPTVKMGNLVLTKDDYYTLTFDSYTKGRGWVTVVGKGIAEGFEKTFYYPILKQDISNQSATAQNAQFNGMPVSTMVNVNNLDVGTEIEKLYQNNINIGTAGVRVVGVDQCYGEVSTTFQIQSNYTHTALPGNCIGTVDSELSDDVYVGEKIIRPAEAQLRAKTGRLHIAAYALYKLEGEELVLIEEKLTDVGYWSDNMFVYDFSAVYEEEADQGGAIYLLSYSWVTDEQEVYAGAMYLFVPAKVLEATSMYMERVENDGDFRKDYFNLCGEDGTLGAIAWSSSNPSVATVEDGIVTMHKPGNATISGQWGDLVESYALTVPQLYLNEGIIFDYSQENGARVIYDGRLLTEGTDYVLSVTQQGDAVTVTASGRGLFAGELMKTFDGMDSLADPHTHSFDNSCDGTCNGCSFTRSNDHQPSSAWKKNRTHHYHVCTLCGEKTDMTLHTLSSEDETVCTVCGLLYIPGDCNGDVEVNNEDVIYLLWHTLFPENYVLETEADFTKDGQVNNEDVIYLLWHTLFPENYPVE